MSFHERTERRDFLKAAGIAATTGLVSGTRSLFANGAVLLNEKRIRKAVKIEMVRMEGTLTDKFRLLKRLGFDGVELPSPNRWNRDDVLRARQEADFTIHGVVDSTHWKTTLSHPDPKVRQQGIEDLKTAIQDSKAYGGTSVLLVPGVVTEGTTYQQAWDRSLPAIREAIPLAADLGIQILMENVWNNFLTDPGETAKFIDQLDSPAVGAYFDVGNAVRYSPPIDWIRILGKRIIKLDIKEFSLKKATQENQGAGFQVELLEGDCNWPAVINELSKIGFQGWATAEIPGGGEDRLRDIAARMDRIFANY
ncbi:MAG: sugar phosphate isomerase/epimerase [Pirellulales bacterium]|nr:sugar phosphate isomerase/epimerase [Pirellulales bacterium]